jgi:hypothetical protein
MLYVTLPRRRSMQTACKGMRCVTPEPPSVGCVWRMHRRTWQDRYSPVTRAPAHEPHRADMVAQTAAPRDRSF